MQKSYDNVVIKLFILLPLVKAQSLFDFLPDQANSSAGPLCSINSLYTWECNNGQCIQIEELCDGIFHCADKSDESVDQCLHKPCPAYAFKCAYGGCITGDYKCNGIIDCIDGSDETRFLCDKSLNYTQELRGRCWLASSMECKSGECVSAEGACDGVPHCSDGSDETVELCSFLQCPEFSFRCGYGACVSGSARCNHIRDCLDGSDESAGLCGKDHYINATVIIPAIPYAGHNNNFYTTPKPDLPSNSYSTSTYRPYAQTSPKYTTTRRPSNGSHFPISRTSPEEPSSTTREYTSSTYVPFSSHTTTTAIPDLATTDSLEGPPLPPKQPHPLPTHYPITTAHPSLPSKKPETAVRFCKSNTLVRGISTVASCSFHSSQVSCFHSLRTYTRAEISCAPGYMRDRKPKPDSTTLVCDQDGEWNRPKFKCFPICGTLNDEQRKSIIKPWDVTITRRSYEPVYQPLCSGAIVSPKIVITAANCLTSPAGGYATDHILYNIVEGVYNFSYDEGDHLSAVIHNVSRITVQTSASTHDLAILIIVNYFRFNNALKPICLPSLQSNVALLSDDRLNLGRGLTRDTTREYLEFIIAKIERSTYGRRTTNIEYIRINNFLPFIMREMQRYRYIL